MKFTFAKRFSRAQRKIMRVAAQRKWYRDNLYKVLCESLSSIYDEMFKPHPALLAFHDRGRFRVGDVVSRDGTDEQTVIEADDGSGCIRVICIKEPKPFDAQSEPWCKLGDEEFNLSRRYELVR